MSALSRLAARFGFESTVPVTMVDQWWQSPVDQAIELAPRGRDVRAHVDRYGRIQIGDSRWALDWLVAGGPRWAWPPASDHVAQTIPAIGTVETTLTTPAGPVIQRVAAGIESGRPVLVVEIENRGGVAVAVALVARPLTLFGRGHLSAAAIDGDGMAIEGARVVRFARPPGAMATAAAADGDLAQSLPEAGAGSAAPSRVECRSGGAQAGAVWPLAHTATLTLVVELAPSTDHAQYPVDPPTVDAIGRGWAAHLRSGMRIEMADTTAAERFATATRTLLTARPEPKAVAAAAVALTEAGHPADAGRLLAALADVDLDEAAVLAAWARWSQLADPMTQLDHLDAGLATVARSAHVVAGRPGPVPGPQWLAPALAVLADRLHTIEQPDVADRMSELAGRTQAEADPSAIEDPAALDLDTAALMHHRAALRHVRATRSVAVVDGDQGIDLLPAVPPAWRGRAIEVYDAPTGAGPLSFGLRWHGPRPALLWEIGDGPELVGPITVRGIDPDFASTERSGEALLADPGWPRPGR